MIMTFTMFLAFGVISWYISAWKNGGADGKGGITFSEWFNGDAENFWISLGVGLSSNIVFGAIDNGGLFFGASFLDEWFQHLPGSEDANVFAG